MRPPVGNPAIQRALEDVMDQLAEELNKHGPMKSDHEANSKLQEELDEYFGEVKKNSGPKPRRRELKQIAAKAIRAMAETTEE